MVRKCRGVSIRLLLAVVAMVAVALALTVPAVKVAMDRGVHSHTWVSGEAGRLGFSASANVISPFWPRYWRRLVGWPYRGLPLCTATQGRETELCEFAYPDMKSPVGAGRFSIDIAPAQSARLEELWASRGRAPR